MVPTAILMFSAEALFYILLLVYTIFGVILGYHWHTYGTTKRTASIATGTYVLAGVCGFAVMALTLFF